MLQSQLALAPLGPLPLWDLGRSTGRVPVLGPWNCGPEAFSTSVNRSVGPHLPGRLYGVIVSVREPGGDLHQTAVHIVVIFPLR